MSAEASAVAAANSVRDRTGIVVPVYFPSGVDGSVGEDLLRDNVAACVRQVADPGRICLSVDGEGCGEEIAAQLQAQWGVTCCTAPENKGKLQAVRDGMSRLFELEELAFFAVVDSDGDHFAHELHNLVRAGLHARRFAGVEEVVILGRRISLHRPLGFLRGELEELADRILLDALAFDAALTGAPLRLECATTLDEVPDFHSGYKLFSRGAARETFLRQPKLSGVGEAAYYRHACEAVMIVEALKGGAYLAVVNRSTLNEQPVSTFGLLDRSRLVADKIVWPCKRLGVPAHFVDQWLRNHMPRLLLNTLAPQGQVELRQIRDLVLTDFGVVPPDDDSSAVRGPLFV